MRLRKKLSLPPPHLLQLHVTGRSKAAVTTLSLKIDVVVIVEHTECESHMEILINYV
jgi:hypothetical protein